MRKDFDTWNGEKKRINEHDTGALYFYEREIWWCSLGVNVGFEQDGTNELFQRPVVILKKYNPQIFLALPLSTTSKRGSYYWPVGIVDGEQAVAILSQLRLLDSKRLTNRIGILGKKEFDLLVGETVAANFPTLKSSPPPGGGGKP
ncbi:type II toxin-antitoxin system PemK/MazF family toxin [Patescibacteria group bacterium]|nr:type II toxin-antitoxin system PemK/MazF family toxin [Patescibacteria group bacterium]MDE1944653.1 type II toxin-antitoxin system PemK/MazF family toxin [Patescibacteria group bacterium]